MSRLLIVSNRLPVTARVERGDVILTQSAGGLATAMRGPHEKLDALWIGWPGSSSDDPRIDERLRAMRTVPLHLSEEQIAGYYDGFSNGVLWPLFHYLIDTVQLDAQRDWESYVEVNRVFADAVVEQYRARDRVWVHDYQLALVPQMIREKIPDARIGFFLHIPFPSSEVFRLLPWREQILRGLLGSDLVGFHTASFRHNFAYSAARVLGLEPDVDTVAYDDRVVRLGVYPISIDVGQFESLARDPAVQAKAREIRDAHPDHQLVIGIDRFDYTKGIPRRLLAFERLLEQTKNVRLIQLAVPTRENVDAYAELRRHTNELVGRINATHGNIAGVPIHLLHRSVSPGELAAMYLAADVMLVTPLRDGMNLVAKEYVATRVDDDGVLVLSEFAGAADELTDALLVNPYDLDSVASAIRRALSMERRERSWRMRALRDHVRTHDVDAWAQSFLDDLAPCAVPRTTVDPPSRSVLEQIACAGSVRLYLDYDGTLVGFAPTPDQAAPDAELLSLLGSLAKRRNTDVHIVSGRLRDDLDRFFGELPVTLHAEHGFWHRPAGGEWRPARDVSLAWKDEARAILMRISSRTRGAFVEEKTASIAWHYRRVDPELASTRLREIRLALVELAREHGLELLHGDKVIELRVKGIHKGLAVTPTDASILAIGDDRTDEDLFAALPPGSIAVHVGPGETRAAYRLPSPKEVRALLTALVS
jgi:trehalose 6-phosphate synthase/phosphatase